eukprot:m.161378 g.161378  ORF g.161378 m.161378 type:complete len:722 (+) comp10285_c0_seq3:244-2409(+)
MAAEQSARAAQHAAMSEQQQHVTTQQQLLQHQLAERDRQIDALQYEVARFATEKEWLQASLAAATLLLRDQRTTARENRRSQRSSKTAFARATSAPGPSRDTALSDATQVTGGAMQEQDVEILTASPSLLSDEARLSPSSFSSSSCSSLPDACESADAQGRHSASSRKSACSDCHSLRSHNALLSSKVEQLVQAAAAAAGASVTDGEQNSASRDDEAASSDAESNVRGATLATPATRSAACSPPPLAQVETVTVSTQCMPAAEDAAVRRSTLEPSPVSPATSNPALWPYHAYAEGNPIAPVTCVPSLDSAAQHPAAFGLFVRCRMAPAYIAKLRKVHGSLENAVREGAQIRETSQTREAHDRTTIAELEAALAMAEKSAIEQERAHERALHTQARRLGELEALVQHLTLKSERIAEAAQRSQEPMAQVTALREQLARSEAINVNLNDQIVSLSAQIASHTDEMRDALRAVEVARVDRLDLTKQVRMLGEQLRTAHADLASSRLETNMLRRGLATTPPGATSSSTAAVAATRGSTMRSAMHQNPALAHMQPECFERSHSNPETGASSPLLGMQRSRSTTRAPANELQHHSQTHPVHPSRQRRTSPLGSLSSPTACMQRSLSNPEGQLAERLAAANAAADLFAVSTGNKLQSRSTSTSSPTLSPSFEQQQLSRNRQSTTAVPLGQQKVLAASTVYARSRTGINTSEPTLAPHSRTSTTFVKSY